MFFADSQQPAFRCFRAILRSDGGVAPQFPKYLRRNQETLARARTSRDALKKWATIVKHYSELVVTFQEDRFPEIIGIVAVWDGKA